MDEEHVPVSIALPRRLMFRWALAMVAVALAGLAAAVWVYRSRSDGVKPPGEGDDP
jgi:hypothetical protein